MVGYLFAIVIFGLMFVFIDIQILLYIFNVVVSVCNGYAHLINL